MNPTNIKWFYYLVNTRASLAQADPDYKRKFVVCYDRPNSNGSSNRLYTAFNNYLDFLTYMNSVPTDEWNYFEVIFGDRSQKFYIDVDVKRDYCPPAVQLDVFANQIIEELISGIQRTWTSLGLSFDLTKHLLIFTSHGLTKRSYHIVVDRYCFDNNKANAEIIKRVTASMPPEMVTVQSGPLKDAKIVDILYSSTQLFRLFQSRKPEHPPRPKVFQKTFSYQGVEYTHDLTDLPNCPSRERQRLEFTYIFQKSCVTFISNCIPVGLEIDNVKPSRPEKEYVSLTPGQVEELSTSVRQWIDLTVWQIILPPSNGIIQLKRKKPGYCQICKRVHEHDNGFIITDSQSGKVYLKCWRSIDSVNNSTFEIGQISGQLQQYHHNTIQQYLITETLPYYLSSHVIELEHMSTSTS